MLVLSFFENIFDRFQINGGLGRAQLEQIYLTAPEIPFPDCTKMCETLFDNPSMISKSGFVSLWRMQTFMDYNVTAKFMRYLGYEEDLQLPFVLYNNPAKYAKLRNTFMSFLVGSHESLNCITQKFLHTSECADLVVNKCTPSNDGTKFLALKSVVVDNTSILRNEQTILQCELLCLVYNIDSPKSFDRLQELYKDNYDIYQYVPCIIIALSEPNTPVLPPSPAVTQFCSKYGLLLPLRLCLSEKVLDPPDIFLTLTKYASGELSTRKGSMLSKVLMGFGLIAALGVGGYCYLRWAKSNNAQN